MTTIEAGMTPAEFISAMNDNNLNLFTEVESDVSIATLLSTLNSNYGKLKDLFNNYQNTPSTTAIGQKASTFIAALNTNFQSIEDAKDADDLLYGNIYATVAGNTPILWYDKDALTTITKDAENAVSRINCKLGTGRDLVTGSCLWHTDHGFRFNGSNGMKSAQWSNFSQPNKIYIVYRHTSWSGMQDCYVFDSYTHNYLTLVMAVSGGTATLVRSYANAVSTPMDGLGDNVWNIVSFLANGAGSVLKGNDTFEINPGYTNGGPLEYNAGAAAMDGFVLGMANAGTNGGKIDVQEVIILNAAPSAEDDAIITQYLKDKIMSKYRFDKGYAILGYDGDYSTITNGTTIAVAAGITKQELYLATQLMQATGDGGQPNGNMGWDGIATKYAQGVSIQNHGYTHESFLTLTVEELAAEFDAMDANVVGHGYPKPTICAYPFGYSAYSRNAVLEAKGKLLGWSTQEAQLQGKQTYRYWLPRVSVTSLMNTEEGMQKYKDLIDYAIANKTVINFYCHGVYADEENYALPAKFQEFCEYLVSSGIEMIWSTDLYSKLDLEE